jgi:hypothetical protein
LVYVNCGIEREGSDGVALPRSAQNVEFGACSRVGSTLCVQRAQNVERRLAPRRISTFCGFATANVEIFPRTETRSTFSSPTKENVERRPDDAPNSTFAAAAREPRARLNPPPSMPQLTYTNAPRTARTPEPTALNASR